MLGVLVLGVCFWWLGDKSSARRHPTPQTMGISNSATGTVATPKTLLSQSTNTLNTNQNPRLAYRLRNTSRTVGQLARQNNALLLENALIDTETGNPLAIPEQSRIMLTWCGFRRRGRSACVGCRKRKSFWLTNPILK